jgi:threonine synthase
MTKPLFMQCVECGHQQEFRPLQPTICEKCQSSWVDAHYDYAAFKRELLRGLPDRPRNLFRYADVLPLESPPLARSDCAVGWTPMRLSHNYANAIGHNPLYIKDERYSPTNSFKDRQAAVAVAASLEADVHEMVIASTGNAAVAYAAACAQAGIKLWVFMTSMVVPEKLREVALYGAEVIKVSGTYDQTKQIAAEFAKRRGLLLDRGASSLSARESMKTIAYEIVEQLGWRSPDWYIQAVSGGLGPLGVYHGFEELLRMGLIEKVPKLAVIQTDGCSPMVKAFKAGKSVAEPVIPETRIAILSTGDPGKPYTYLWKLIERYGGTMESVSDHKAFASMRQLAKTDGISVEPATAVAFGGLEKMVQQGILQPDELVVINCTGHTFPVEKHVLGDQLSVDLELESEGSKEKDTSSLREGLSAALERLDERTTTVLIIDDNPDDAHLVRRILEARKTYRVFHSADPWDGLAQARQRRPDLIVLDMMMPGLDGLGVLEELKLDKRTENIPVVVVSAKDISREDRVRFGDQVAGIYQKGSLPPRAFADQVVGVLEQKTTQSNKGES